MSLFAKRVLYVARTLGIAIAITLSLMVGLAGTAFGIIWLFGSAGKTIISVTLGLIYLACFIRMAWDLWKDAKKEIK